MMLPIPSSLYQLAELFNSGAYKIPKTQAGSTQLQTVLTFFFGLIGAVALLVITIAGLQYIVSQGDPQKTAKAKDAILYAVIGLAIAVSGATIVRLVIGNVG
jgi:NhaP-type Na+/H+ or K+/H+ antiporter